MTIKFPDGDQEFRSRLVQTQTASKTSSSSTNAHNYSDTGLSKSISISSGNVVLVMVSGNVRTDNSGNRGYYEAEGQLRVVRGSTVLKGQTVGFRNGGANNKDWFGMISFGFIDSPGAGNHTYKVQVRHHLSASYSNYLIVNRSRDGLYTCLLYTSPSPRDLSTSRMPSSA